MTSKHWKRWLGVENRCVVPFTVFSEFNKAEGGDIWFALDESRPLACFAGIWTRWTSVRKVKEGETTNDLFAFLTTEPNAEVGAIHPKAMPVILTTPRRDRDLDDGPCGRGVEAAAAAAGWSAADRRARREGRLGRADNVTVEDDARLRDQAQGALIVRLRPSPLDHSPRSRLENRSRRPNPN